MPNQEKQKSRRFWKIVITVIVVWVVIVPVVAVVALGIFRHQQQKSREAERVVPSVVGLDLKTAESKARDAGFSIEVIGTHSDLPGNPGTIAEQIPAAGTSIYLRQIGVITRPDRNPEQKPGNKQ
jgi:beta-lactam-binding protein with PASTA domain